MLLSGIATAPVSVSTEFAVNTTTIKQGESAQFTDQSAGNPTSWSWTFPGGTPQVSSEQHPVVTYTVPGKYDVSLTVSNEYGNHIITKEQHIAKEQYISVEAVTGYEDELLPFAAVYPNPTNGQLNLNFPDRFMMVFRKLLLIMDISE